MSRIRHKDTAFEEDIFKELRRRGLRFKTHDVSVLGKPDIVVLTSRKAVFLHSDFWHGWRLSSWEHVLPSDFWREKLNRNRRRDRYVLRKLRRDGWRVLVVWGHQVKKDKDNTLNKIGRFLSE